MTRFAHPMFSPASPRRFLSSPSTFDLRPWTLDLLSYIPFFSPINWFQDRWWLLALPLVFLLAMAYKAMRVRFTDVYWRQVVAMSIQVLVGMIVLAVTLHVVTGWLVPWLST